MRVESGPFTNNLRLQVYGVSSNKYNNLRKVECIRNSEYIDRYNFFLDKREKIGYNIDIII